MEFAAFASFAVLVVAWVILPLRTRSEPAVQLIAAEALAEPAAA